MGVTGRDVHNPDLAVGHRIFDDLRVENVAETDDALPLDHTEFFDLGVVIMIAAGDARPGAGDENLPGLGRFDQLEQPAASIRLELHGIGQIVNVIKGHVGGIKAFDQRVGKIREDGFPAPFVE